MPCTSLFGHHGAPERSFSCSKRSSSIPSLMRQAGRAMFSQGNGSLLPPPLQSLPLARQKRNWQGSFAPSSKLRGIDKHGCCNPPLSTALGTSVRGRVLRPGCCGCNAGFRRRKVSNICPLPTNPKLCSQWNNCHGCNSCFAPRHASPGTAFQVHHQV